MQAVGFGVNGISSVSKGVHVLADSFDPIDQSLSVGYLLHHLPVLQFGPLAREVGQADAISSTQSSLLRENVRLSIFRWAGRWSLSKM